MRFIASLVCIFILAFPAHAFPMSGGKAVEKQIEGLTSYDFIDSMGVCSHLGRTTAENFNNVKTALQYLGIKYVRYDLVDGVAADTISTDLYNDIGVKFVGIFPSNFSNYSTATGFINTKPQKFLALEGPNEVYYNPVAYDGWPKYEAERQAMGRIWRDYSSTFTIYGASLGTNGIAFSSNYSQFSGHYNNLHLYPANYGGIYVKTTAQSILMSGKQFVITEEGSHTKTKTGDSTGTLIAVTPLVQAKYLLNAFFFAKILGVEKTFAYELIDRNDEEIMTTLENHFGVFQYDMTPKLSADVIHRLTTLLSDINFYGAVEKNITVSSGTTIRTLQVHKSDGSMWLGLSQQESIWNSNTGQEIINPDVSTKVTLPKYGCVVLHDVIKNTKTELGCGTAIYVNVPDYFVLLKIEGL